MHNSIFFFLFDLIFILSSYRYSRKKNIQKNTKNRPHSRTPTLSYRKHAPILHTRLCSHAERICSHLVGFDYYDYYREVYGSVDMDPGVVYAITIIRYIYINIKVNTSPLVAYVCEKPPKTIPTPTSRRAWAKSDVGNDDITSVAQNRIE